MTHLTYCHSIISALFLSQREQTYALQDAIESFSLWDKSTTLWKERNEGRKGGKEGGGRKGLREGRRERGRKKSSQAALSILLSSWPDC